MKYQAIVVPNGLIAHLSGPFHSPQNDCSVLNESNLLSHLESHAIQPGWQQNDPPECHYFQVYGDSEYGVCDDRSMFECPTTITWRRGMENSNGWSQDISGAWLWYGAERLAQPQLFLVAVGLGYHVWHHVSCWHPLEQCMCMPSSESDLPLL